MDNSQTSASDEGAALGRLKLKRVRVTTSELAKLVSQSQTAANGANGELSALLSALAQRFDVPAVDLRQLVIPLKYLEVLQEEEASRWQLLPLFMRSDRLLVATVDPDNETNIAALRERISGEIDIVVALEGHLIRTITDAYALLRAGQDYFIGADVRPDFFESRGLSDPRHEAAATRADTSERLEVSPFLGTQALDLDVAVVDTDRRRRTGIERHLRAIGCHISASQATLEALPSTPTTLRLVLVDKLDHPVFKAIPSALSANAPQDPPQSEPYSSWVVLVPKTRGWRFVEEVRARLTPRTPVYSYPAPTAMIMTWLAPQRAQPMAQDAVKEAARRCEREGPKAALAHLQNCIREGLCHVDVYLQAGLLLAKLGQTEQAAEVLEWALIADPTHFVAAKNLALLYETLRCELRARDTWERAWIQAPDRDVARVVGAHLSALLKRSGPLARHSATKPATTNNTNRQSLQPLPERLAHSPSTEHP